MKAIMSEWLLLLITKYPSLARNILIAEDGWVLDYAGKRYQIDKSDSKYIQIKEIKKS